MLDILSDYLDMAGTPEDKLIVLNAFKVFERIGLEDYEHAYEEIIHTEEEVDAGGTLSAIMNLTSSLQHNLLRQFSIVVTEDGAVPFVTALLNGLLDLENHEERIAIERTVQLEIPDREKLCELMRFTTPFIVEDMLPFIEDVSPALFTRLLEQGTEHALEDEEIAADRQAKLHAFRLYDAWLPDGAPARVRDLLRRGVDVGMPYVVYASTAAAEFEQMEPDTIAEEMFGMALISSDGASRAAETVKEHLEQFVGNTDTITAVMAQINLIVTGFKPT